MLDTGDLALVEGVYERALLVSYIPSTCDDYNITLRRIRSLVVLREPLEVRVLDPGHPVLIPVSYTHLTLPTKRIV